MASYDLAVLCYHQASTLSVHPHMSYSEIMELIASRFDISVDSFELQVYDEQFQTYIDFDDECTERLRQLLPRTRKKTLPAQVLFHETREAEPEFSYFRNALSPLHVAANSPSGMSVSEDPRSPITIIDTNLCLLDDSLSSPNDTHSSSADVANSISHLVFVRDVASYQRTQHQQSSCQRDTIDICSKKKKYIIRIQGVKTDHDNKYASILPEIKFPSHVLRQDQMTLVVAVVIEEHNKEQVIWHLDAQKGFLRDDIETDTISYNPIWLKIDRSALINDGILR
ncbi:unnamed protein product [Rotaria sp. Silwood1]|nr:unnamed protein product [Rotaria sp. Silwood1]CAF1636382.1 unnamed protein product [Rotaria sp. Silwood1]CAF3737420.1 unnamed protein product [Rotaria sp. Silwood1]CAF3768412.1 unnamed protein product [Rotaria sp. Silwood1]CAF3829085.1 unnamed protein product [Rotaria sp. Silwood1]